MIRVVHFEFGLWCTHFDLACKAWGLDHRRNPKTLNPEAQQKPETPEVRTSFNPQNYSSSNTRNVAPPHHVFVRTEALLLQVVYSDAPHRGHEEVGPGTSVFLLA